MTDVDMTSIYDQPVTMPGSENWFMSDDSQEIHVNLKGKVMGIVGTETIISVKVRVNGKVGRLSEIGSALPKLSPTKLPSSHSPFSSLWHEAAAGQAQSGIVPFAQT
ncbi:UNVERIFIED_CONTAM: hypothetical protein K2H54_048079 [Gekko kuhli]